MKYSKLVISTIFFVTFSITSSIYFAEKIDGTSVLAQTNNSREAEADRLFEQGVEQDKKRQFDAAIQSWEQARIIYREIGNPRKEANALGNIGVMYRAKGEYTKSLEKLTEVLKIMKSLNNPIGISRALQQLGLLYDQIGKFEEAIDVLTKQLTLAQEIKNLKEEATAQGNLGLVYLHLDNYDLGSHAMQEQLRISKEIQDKKMQEIALSNLGLLNTSKENYEKAIYYYEQVLALIRERKDRTAERYLQGNLGLLYRIRGNYNKAIEALREYVAVTQETNDRREAPEALNNLGVVLYESGNIDEAVPTLYKAIEGYESLRGELDDSNKISIADRQSRAYGTLQIALRDLNRINEALEVSERGRARAFADLLARRLSSSSTIPSESIIKIEKIKTIAGEQNATIVEYWQSIGNDKIFIWVVKPTGEITFRQADIKPLQEKQKRSLDKFIDDSIIAVTTGQDNAIRGDYSINFAVGDRVRLKSDEASFPARIVVSVDNQNRQITVRFPDSSTTDTVLMSQVSQKIEKNNSQSNTNAQNLNLQELHKLLIKPIANLLPTDENAHVIFVPHRELFAVPFPALQDETGKYLIEKHTILTAPSIQVLESTRKIRRRQIPSNAKNVLIVGNPEMPSIREPEKAPQKLEQLPNAEEEAKAIAPLFNTTPLLGNQATKAAIKPLLSNARIIHFATHGILDDRRGLGSAIALSPTGEDDGWLTAEEILNLNLNAELVVLSACKTGKGRITGDGVIGLSRSLILAGVPSVIVSLWNVPDVATAPLMKEFYQQIQRNPDKAQALRQAMLITMKQNPNPINWAAFTLIGEAE
jgi:CHAT domain-containing protein/lipopolysaccharide biosynthesis regulator YciM